MKKIKVYLLMSTMFVLASNMVVAQNEPIVLALRDYEVAKIASTDPGDEMKNIFFWEDGEKLTEVNYLKSGPVLEFVKKAESLVSYNTNGGDQYLLVNFVYMPEFKKAQIFAPKLDQTYLVKVDRNEKTYQINLYTVSSKFGNKQLFKSFDSKSDLSDEDQQLLSTMIALM